jgi:glucosamine--fructose-6-phosphate aminotransferase (isomerizing)
MMALLLGADSRAKMPKRIAAMRALARLPDDAREVLELDASMHKLAEQLKDAQSLIFFGRGYNFSTALEAALKVLGHWLGVCVCARARACVCVCVREGCVGV